MDEFDMNIYRTLFERGIDPSTVRDVEYDVFGNIIVYHTSNSDNTSNLMPHISHDTIISSKTKNSYNPDFDFPENFELSNKLFEEYWNKKIQKHGSLENALWTIHKIGINPNIRENNNAYLENNNLNQVSEAISINEDTSDLEHKMRQMRNIANSINLPRNCLTDKQHYIGLQQSVNSIIPGDQSSYSSLERSLNELKKNWGNI
ncbi:MAG: hypothetical protein VW298_02670 [Candidatus Woesearchaeota archaeon]